LVDRSGVKRSWEKSKEMSRRGVKAGSPGLCPETGRNSSLLSVYIRVYGDRRRK